jgi:hypothetical protein
VSGHVLKLGAFLAFGVLAIFPVAAQESRELVCPFLECGPGDSQVPPPAAEMSPSQQSPVSAPSGPKGPTPATADLPAVAAVPDVRGDECTQLDFGTVCTTSVLPKWRTVTYGPANMFDGRLDTAWVEGVDGVGAGERITFIFDDERLVSGISFLNGYHKSNDLFQKNGRITAINVDTSSGEQLTTQVADDPGEQVRTFEQPVRLKWITIRIASAVAGSKYTDTAISEMRVLFE